MQGCAQLGVKLRGTNSSVRPRRGHKMSIGGSPLPPVRGRQSPLGPAKGTTASA